MSFCVASVGVLVLVLFVPGASAARRADGTAAGRGPQEASSARDADGRPRTAGALDAPGLRESDRASEPARPSGGARSADSARATQTVWRDNHTVVYALAGDYGADLYTALSDGTGTPRRITTAALSPAYLG